MKPPVWFRDWRDNEYAHLEEEVHLIGEREGRNTVLLYVILSAILAGAIAIIVAGG